MPKTRHVILMARAYAPAKTIANSRRRCLISAAVGLIIISRVFERHHAVNRPSLACNKLTVEREPPPVFLVPYPSVVICHERPNIRIGVKEESHRPIEIIVLV